MTMEGLNYYTKDEVDQLLDTGGLMKLSTYDTNESGVVDNTEKVNNHTVESDVPANAKFTDTTLSAGSGISIINGVIRCTRAD